MCTASLGAEGLGALQHKSCRRYWYLFNVFSAGKYELLIACIVIFSFLKKLSFPHGNTVQLFNNAKPVLCYNTMSRGGSTRGIQLLLSKNTVFFTQPLSFSSYNSPNRQYNHVVVTCDCSPMPSHPSVLFSCVTWLFLWHGTSFCQILIQKTLMCSSSLKQSHEHVVIVSHDVQSQGFPTV